MDCLAPDVHLSADRILHGRIGRIQVGDGVRLPLRKQFEVAGDGLG